MSISVLYRKEGRMTVDQMGRRPSAMERRRAFWNQTSSITSLPDERSGRLLGSNRNGGGGLAIMAPRASVHDSFPAFPTCINLAAAAFAAAISRPGCRNRRLKHRSRSLCPPRLRIFPPAAKCATFTLLGCTTNPGLLLGSRRRYLRRSRVLENDSYISISIDRALRT